VGAGYRFTLILIYILDLSCALHIKLISLQNFRQHLKMPYTSHHILIHHHYFTEQLRNEQFRIYGNDILLIQPGQT
jgi:hypothetical protein